MSAAVQIAPAEQKDRKEVQVTASPQVWPGMQFFEQAFDYCVDAWQRSVLFLDILRQRGNNHFEVSTKQAPNVLNFDFEVIMDGRYITEMRTAAVSAVAARHLARADAAVLAVIGSGVQARSHVELLTLVRPFREIRAWSPTNDHVRRFVSEAAALSPVPVHAAASAEQAVREAGVIAIVTSSATPVVQDAWVSPGAMVISVGACRPDTREMDPALVARSRVIVDSRAGALAEAGDIVQGIREGRWDETHIAGELGEVILGRTPGRTTPDEIVVFKSLGMAVEDVATAQLVLTRAKAQSKGREIAM